MIIQNIRNFLYEKKVRNIDVDDNKLLEIHFEILQSKKMLRSTFEYFYRTISALCDDYLETGGLEIELGSGAGFFKHIRPSVITTDVRKGAYVEMELDAQSMSFLDQSCSCFFAINVFHHLQSPERFLNELIRVLEIGGGCILIEPHKGICIEASILMWKAKIGTQLILAGHYLVQIKQCLILFFFGIQKNSTEFMVKILR